MILDALTIFRFCGRVFALALKHKVQVGITLDKLFFLQLAGKEISLEDVRNADPFMYKSCKDILEMNADFIDSDAMGLTFRHCFVKSIAEKVAYFTQGFGDILSKPRLQKIFFRSLEFKDLDGLLLGSDKAICVKDWKARYHDYNETNEHICWFWKAGDQWITFAVVWMKSKEYEQTNQAVRDLVRSIERMCDPDNSDPIIDIVQGVKDFLRMIPSNNRKKSMNQLLFFQCLDGPNALVSLFTSPIKGNKELGEESIRFFLINPISRTGFLLPKPVQNQCAMIFLDLCNLLYQADYDDDQQRLLYNSCHETLITILKSIACANRSTYFGFAEASPFLILLLDQFFADMSNKLDLYLSTLSGCSRSSFLRDVRAFTIISLHMRRAIEEYVRSNMGQSLPLCVDRNFRKHPCYRIEIESYLDNFHFVALQLRNCMSEWKSNIYGIGTTGLHRFNPMWSYYLSILKELKCCSKLYQSENDLLSQVIHDNWLMINYIIMHSKRRDEHQWILLECEKVSNIESKRHLIMAMMYPVVKNGEQKLLEITIDRSQLLTESFQQISNANLKLLGYGLFVVFKHEVSTLGRTPLMYTTSSSPHQS